MEDETETPKPSKIKQLLPLVGMLVLGLGGGAAGMFFMAPKPDPEDAGAVDAEGEHGEGEAKAEGHEAPAEGEGHGEKKEAAKEGEGEHGEAKKEEGHGEAAPEHGEAPAEGHGGAAKAEKAEGPAPSITNLGNFTINLRGSGGGRILRLEVQVDTDPESSETIKALTPKIRDSVIAVVSDYTWSELEGTDGKTRLKDELLARIGGIAEPVEVHSVYLTTFVVS